MEQNVAEFKELWKETTNTVVYSFVQYHNSHFLISNRYVRSLIHHEAWEMRWDCRKFSHPAKRFLDTLEAKAPQKSRAIADRICNLSPHIGYSPAMLAAGAVCLGCGILLLFFFRLLGILIALVGAGILAVTLFQGYSVPNLIRRYLDACGLACIQILTEGKEEENHG